ncbi:unnamed protein product [marine sediment metagenome]|uniref:Uncharacterized protein n=1 Tax=marine sediment metagenome TaxID=412755 RepID=X0V9D1_9ZZZZ
MNKWIIFKTLEGKSYRIREDKIMEICLCKDGITIQMEEADHKIGLGYKDGEYANELDEEVYDSLVCYLKDFTEKNCYNADKLEGLNDRDIIKAFVEGIIERKREMIVKS